jgi:hypothetical protein
VVPEFAALNDCVVYAVSVLPFLSFSHLLTAPSMIRVRSIVNEHFLSSIVLAPSSAARALLFRFQSMYLQLFAGPNFS